LRVGGEQRAVEDELGVGVGAEQDLGIEARQVDVRKGNGVAGDRTETGLPIWQLGELGDEAVLAVGGLLERRLVELAGACPPAPEAVALDEAALHLDGEEALLRVGEKDVALPFPLDPVLPDEPRNVVKHRVLGRERCPQPLLDIAFRARTEGVGAGVDVAVQHGIAGAAARRGERAARWVIGPPWRSVSSVVGIVSRPTGRVP
jgi:hypothetical protein